MHYGKRVIQGMECHANRRWLDSALLTIADPLFRMAVYSNHSAIRNVQKLHSANVCFVCDTQIVPFSHSDKHLNMLIQYGQNKMQ